MMQAPLQIISWNVNSINIRREHIHKLLEDQSPDILLLQEIKCIYFEPFPGYKSYIHGQKAYHGVAILIKQNISIDSYNIIHLSSRNESRCIQITIQNLMIICVYVPCGWSRCDTSIDIEYINKYSFIKNLYNYVYTQLTSQNTAIKDIVIGGDLNISMTDDDVQYPERNTNHILCNQNIRNLMHKFLDLGFYNNYTGYMKYSWKSYQERKGYMMHGEFRIDYILSTINCRQEISNPTYIHDQPSDHYPISIYMPYNII